MSRQPKSHLRGEVQATSCTNCSGRTFRQRNHGIFILDMGRRTYFSRLMATCAAALSPLSWRGSHITTLLVRFLAFCPKNKLTCHVSKPDTAFNEAFLITFKSFTTPAELIDSLVVRFEKEPPDGLDDEETLDWKRNWQDPVRGRVINTMRRLLVEDDCITSDDKEALEKMKAFIAKHEHTYPGVKMVAGTLQTLVR